MNIPLSPCDTRLEAISLLAADCLAEAEERALREHLVTCDGCRSRYEELRGVCQSVRAARPVIGKVPLRVLEQPHPAEGSRLMQGRRMNRPVRWPAAALVAGLVVLSGISLLVGRAMRTEMIRDRNGVVTAGGPRQEHAEPEAAELPTLLVLRRAAAESDESLDRMLARYDAVLAESPLDARPVRSDRTDL